MDVETVVDQVDAADEGDRSVGVGDLPAAEAWLERGGLSFLEKQYSAAVADLQQALARQRGHALLVQGAEGIGIWPFLQALARAWLCETEDDQRPCGRCMRSPV